VTPLDSLHRRLHRAFRDSSERFRGFDRSRQITWGTDTRAAGARYDWEGSRRGTAANPQVIFQYTLSGRGEFIARKKTWSVGPEHGFLALFPSSHRYFLPADSHQWTFFWFIVRHPLIVERIRQLLTEEEPVQWLPQASAATEAAAALFEAACASRLRYTWNFEERLFTWLWALERELYHRRYPTEPREHLLEGTRRLVLRRLERPPSGAELAEAHGLDRSAFCRKFRIITGGSPSAFVMEVRLEEALKRLRTGAKLETIAAQTGFADANHFCKVFRRHFLSSPGAYRELISGINRNLQM